MGSTEISAPRGTERLHAIPDELVCLNRDADRQSVEIDLDATGGECCRALREGKVTVVLLYTVICKKNIENLPTADKSKHFGWGGINKTGLKW